MTAASDSLVSIFHICYFISDIPVFIVRPADKTVLEGSTVVIRCEGQGQAKPVSTWYSIDDQGQRVLMLGSFNDVEVSSDGRFIIRVCSSGPKG